MDLSGRKNFWLGAVTLIFGFIFMSAAWGQVQRVDISIHDNKGKEVCRFEAETAVTAKEQERGLMFRKYMPARTGMLFMNKTDQMHYFWMKNTYIPLDLIFIDAQHKVVHIHYNALPHDESPISSQYPARYILEVNAGEAAECSVRRGTRIHIVFPKNK